MLQACEIDTQSCIERLAGVAGMTAVELFSLPLPPTAAVVDVVEEEVAGFMAGFEGLEGFEGRVTCSCRACATCRVQSQPFCLLCWPLHADNYTALHQWVAYLCEAVQHRLTEASATAPRARSTSSAPVIACAHSHSISKYQTTKQS